MKKALEAYESLVIAWDDYLSHMKINKPDQVRIAQYGFEDVDISEIGIPWNAWKEVVSLQDEPTDITFEKKLIRHLNAMQGQLAEGKNQEVKWLLNTSSFLSDVAEISQICFVLAPAVRGFADAIEQANLTSVKVAAAEVHAENEKFKNTLAVVTKNVEEITRYAEEVEGVKNTLAKANENLIEVNLTLKDARADLNKQGLSGAFTAAATNFNNQRWMFAAAFVFALVGIFIIGIRSKSEFESITDLKFLSGIVLASPFVWLGWFSTRQLSQLAKVQQDYEYKKATALAFEAHKKEIVEADNVDKELSKRLLETVIKNFGDNPVRLLPSASNDHGHPVEELISKLSDTKVVEQIIKAYEAAKK